jgi:hypothetical protein
MFALRLFASLGDVRFFRAGEQHAAEFHVASLSSEDALKPLVKLFAGGRCPFEADGDTVSVHGRDLEAIRPGEQQGAFIECAVDELVAVKSHGLFREVLPCISHVPAPSVGCAPTIAEGEGPSSLSPEGLRA